MAQETLDQVEDIETTLNSSEHVRQEVMSLQEQTDEMIANINNITETVSKHNPVLFHWKCAEPCSTRSVREQGSQSQSGKRNF